MLPSVVVPSSLQKSQDIYPGDGVSENASESGYRALHYPRMVSDRLKNLLFDAEAHFDRFHTSILNRVR